jgi:hypothetical protein
MPYKITVRDSNLDNQVVLEETVMDTSFSPVQYLMSLHIPGLEIKEPGEYTHENYSVSIQDLSPAKPQLEIQVKPKETLPEENEVDLSLGVGIEGEEGLEGDEEDDIDESLAETDLLDITTLAKPSTRKRKAT